MGELAMWRQRVEEFVLGQVGPPPARVLEVGCGEGELACALARVGYSVTAIDLRAPEGAIFRRVGIEEFTDPGSFAESYFAEWASEEGLHSSLGMRDELGSRFVERFFEWVPYLYPD
jgi:cyclopropane fatty-acyl-phospholipid synthase-like methyltransferase